MAFCNTEEDIVKQIPFLIEKGESLEGPENAIPEGGYGHIRSMQRPLAAVAVIRNTGESFEFVTAYPAPIDVADNELEIHSIEASTDDKDFEFEKCVRAITRDGGEITFFCPAYPFFKSMLESAPRFRFGLGAIAYTLEKAPGELTFAEGDFFEHEKKRRMEEEPNFDPATFTSITVGMDTLRCYFERGEGDFEFQSVVEEVIPFEFLSAKGYLMLVNLMPEDRAPIMVKIYASEKVLGPYVPQVGDPVRGVAGLQGVPMEVIPADELWMDSSDAAYEGGRYDGLMEGVSWMFANEHLPVAMQAVGGAFIGAGWEITYIEQNLFRDFAPAFSVEKADRSYFVFVRSGIKGFCHPASWSEEIVKRREESAAAQGAKCLHLTVNLEPVGKSFDVSVEGLGELSDEIRVVLSSRRPEYFEWVKIGEEDKLDPVLDETVAAATFAQCITNGNLGPLSRMLVEDLEYVSESVECHIKGRQQFLAYIGNLIDAWQERGLILAGKPGKAFIEGAERPCAFSFSNEKTTPFACTFFKGRRGHIAAIRNINPETLESMQINDNNSCT